MWPSFDQSPLKGLANYDFRFTDRSLQDDEGLAAKYEEQAPLPAVESKDVPVVRAQTRAVRVSNAEVQES